MDSHWLPLTDGHVWCEWDDVDSEYVGKELRFGLKWKQLFFLLFFFFLFLFFVFLPYAWCQTQGRGWLDTAETDLLWLSVSCFSDFLIKESRSVMDFFLAPDVNTLLTLLMKWAVGLWSWGTLCPSPSLCDEHHVCISYIRLLLFTHHRFWTKSGTEK